MVLMFCRDDSTGEDASPGRHLVDPPSALRVFPTTCQDFSVVFARPVREDARFDDFRMIFSDIAHLQQDMSVQVQF